MFKPTTILALFVVLATSNATPHHDRAKRQFNVVEDYFTTTASAGSVDAVTTASAGSVGAVTTASAGSVGAVTTASSGSVTTAAPGDITSTPAGGLNTTTVATATTTGNSTSNATSGPTFNFPGPWGKRRCNFACKNVLRWVMRTKYTGGSFDSSSKKCTCTK